MMLLLVIKPNLVLFETHTTALNDIPPVSYTHLYTDESLQVGTTDYTKLKILLCRVMKSSVKI